MRVVAGGAGSVWDMMTRAWHAVGPWQGWLAWAMHAKFACGVTGVVRSGDGQVLLLRHRLWAVDGQWGFPSGFARRGERFEDTVVREVREETMLTVTVGRLLAVRSGYQYKAEVYYEAVLSGGLDGLVLDSREILDARLFPLSGLPAGMPAMHRELALRGAQGRGLAARPGNLGRGAGCRSG